MNASATTKSFRAQFKVNPDNVLRSHSSTFTLLILCLSLFSPKIAVCDVGRRKLKFQIVYNYFSINCHTLHSTALQTDSDPVQLFLLHFSSLLNYGRFFSLDICFWVFCVFFWVRKLIIYRSLICFFFRCFFTWSKSFFRVFTLCFCAAAMNFHNFDELNGNLMKMQLKKSNITVFLFIFCWLRFKLLVFL